MDTDVMACMHCMLQTCPDPEGFKDALQQYFTDIQQEAAWVDTNGAEAMSAVLELVRRHKVRLIWQRGVASNVGAGSHTHTSLVHQLQMCTR